jgi:NADPH-dependent glutamate synthase beta subunit-like oxidoreductase
VICICTYFTADGVCYGYTTEEIPQVCGEFTPQAMDKFSCVSNDDREKLKNYQEILVAYIKKQDEELKRCKLTKNGH